MYTKRKVGKVRFESYISAGLNTVLKEYAELHNKTITETIEDALSSYLHNKIVVGEQ